MNSSQRAQLTAFILVVFLGILLILFLSMRFGGEVNMQSWHEREEQPGPTAQLEILRAMVQTQTLYVQRLRSVFLPTNNEQERILADASQTGGEACDATCLAACTLLSPSSGAGTQALHAAGGLPPGDLRARFGYSNVGGWHAEGTAPWFSFQVARVDVCGAAALSGGTLQPGARAGVASVYVVSAAYEESGGGVVRRAPYRALRAQYHVPVSQGRAFELRDGAGVGAGAGSFALRSDGEGRLEFVYAWGGGAWRLSVLLEADPGTAEAVQGGESVGGGVGQQQWMYPRALAQVNGISSASASFGCMARRESWPVSGLWALDQRSQRFGPGKRAGGPRAGVQLRVWLGAGGDGHAWLLAGGEQRGVALYPPLVRGTTVRLERAGGTTASLVLLETWGSWEDPPPATLRLVVGGAEYSLLRANDAPHQWSRGLNGLPQWKPVYTVVGGGGGELGVAMLAWSDTRQQSSALLAEAHVDDFNQFLSLPYYTRGQDAEFCMIVLMFFIVLVYLLVQLVVGVAKGRARVQRRSRSR